MPEGIPRGLKAEQAIAAFVKAGGIRRSGKGSHTNIKMPNGQIVTIPNHGELKVGLLQAAIKKAGMTVNEFLALIGR
ncbi:MAG: type II toxin-antitoxin system HicA family toxin [Armatimonadota bacterium]